MAGGGFAGAAEFSGGGAERDAARSLDDFADAAVDRCGNASSSIRLGTGVAGGEGSFEGGDDRHRWYDLEANAAMRSIVRRGTGGGCQGCITRRARDSGVATRTGGQ